MTSRRRGVALSVGPPTSCRRRDHAGMFTRDVVRFDQTVSVTLDRDAHLIVATVGLKPNGDLLGVPLHHPAEPTRHGHRHPHGADHDH